MNASDYIIAIEPREIAESLIPEYHAHLENPEVRVLYAYFSKERKSKGALIWGSASKLSGREAFLMQRDADPEERCEHIFLLEFHASTWLNLKDNQKRALVDHELSHCLAEVTDENETKTSVLPHDLEEFRAIYARHVAWRKDIEEFLSAPHRDLQMRFNDLFKPDEHGTKTRLSVIVGGEERVIGESEGYAEAEAADVAT